MATQPGCANFTILVTSDSHDMKSPNVIALSATHTIALDFAAKAAAQIVINRSLFLGTLGGLTLGGLILPHPLWKRKLTHYPNFVLGSVLISILALILIYVVVGIANGEISSTRLKAETIREPVMALEDVVIFSPTMNVHL